MQTDKLLAQSSRFAPTGLSKIIAREYCRLKNITITIDLYAECYKSKPLIAESEHSWPRTCLVSSYV